MCHDWPPGHFYVGNTWWWEISWETQNSVDLCWDLWTCTFLPTPVSSHADLHTNKWDRITAIKIPDVTALVPLNRHPGFMTLLTVSSEMHMQHNVWHFCHYKSRDYWGCNVNTLYLIVKLNFLKDFKKNYFLNVILPIGVCGIFKFHPLVCSPDQFTNKKRWFEEKWFFCSWDWRCPNCGCIGSPGHQLPIPPGACLVMKICVLMDGGLAITTEWKRAAFWGLMSCDSEVTVLNSKKLRFPSNSMHKVLLSLPNHKSGWKCNFFSLMNHGWG